MLLMGVSTIAGTLLILYVLDLLAV